jgi:VWFA-related protein
MHISSRVCCALALTLASPAVAAADDPPPAPQRTGATFGEEVEVTVVNVDVYVRDRKGRPVEGLTADDFRLTQDGVEMPISNFAAFTGTGEGPSDGRENPDAAVLAAVPSGHTARPVSIVLYIDNVNLLALQRNRVLNRVRTFVEENLAPPVQMMVVSSQPSLAVRQPYTDDPGAVIAALDAVATESAGRFARDRDRREILVWMEELASDARRDAPEFLDAVPMQVVKVQVQAQILAFVEQESDILEDSLITLHEVLRLTSDREGRKVVIHVSNGLPMTPGLGLLHEFEAVFRDSSIYSRIARQSFAAEFRNFVAAANGQGVSLYAIDASGLAPLEGFGADDRYVPEAMASSVSMKNLQESLSFMADGTGGLAVLNTNGVSGGLHRVRDDLVSYYSLGYQIVLSGEDLQHRIRVELPGRPKTRVRYREWFVEKSPLTQMRERVLTTLIRDPGHNAMGVVLSALEATSKPDRRRDLRLKVSIPLASLTLRPEGSSRVGEIQVVVGLRDATGREAAPQAVTLELRIPVAQIAPGAVGQRVAVVLPLRIIRGRLQHTVAVGVRNLASGETSYARLFVRGS